MTSDNQIEKESAAPQNVRRELFFKKINSETIKLIISIISLLLSIIALLVSTSPFGRVRPLPPSGFAIMRTLESSPSDHVILPLEWENTKNSPVLIRKPELILKEMDDKGEETGYYLTFSLAGEYSDISIDGFLKDYSIKRSFTIDTHSVQLRVLVFHIDEWWDERNPNYKFQFTEGKIYKVYIRYQENLKSDREFFLYDMPIYDDVSQLDRGSDYWWDFWSTE